MLSSTSPEGDVVPAPSGGTDTTAGPGRALDSIIAGSTTGVGSLPHRSAHEAAEFSLDAYDLPAIPSLPRRCPAESSVAQALVGIPGITLGQYGTVAIDVEALDPGAPITTDLHSGNFVGFRTFLDVASAKGFEGPVKWHFVGPISVGVALRRAGADPDTAFHVAGAAVRSHLLALSDAVTETLPATPQLVVLNEPFAADMTSREFPLPPDASIDLLSAAMAVLEPTADVGVHCCSEVDVAALLESGPSVLSLPATDRVLPLVGQIDRFLRNGGWIAWGAIATEGPIAPNSQRAWHRLAKLWCELVQRGCDPEQLRSQCLLTPECGLSCLSTTVADRICTALHGVSRSVRGEAAAARFVLGA